MNKKNNHSIFSGHMLCTGGLALFCAVSFPLLAFAETAEKG